MNTDPKHCWKEDVLFQPTIRGASEKLRNQPRHLLKPTCVHFRQHYQNLSHETVPLRSTQIWKKKLDFYVQFCDYELDPDPLVRGTDPQQNVTDPTLLYSTYLFLTLTVSILLTLPSTVTPTRPPTPRRESGAPAAPRPACCCWELLLLLLVVVVVAVDSAA